MQTKVRGERSSVKEWRGEGGEEALPPLFGLEIDRLSLSPNLSISPSLLCLPPSLHLAAVQKGVEKMKGRQRYKETE